MNWRLIDTNIASFAIKQHPIFRKYRRHLAGFASIISFQTHAELLEWRKGISWSVVRLQRFDTILSGLHIVQSDERIADHWAEIRLQRRLQPISTDDAWIAATALAYGVELVTHNPSDFGSIAGLRIITEFP